MADTNVVFKIRDKNTGLFKNAGFYGGFSKTGKVWRNTAALSGHLALHTRWDSERRQRVSTVPDNWEIVHLRTEEVAAQPASEYIRGRRIMKEKGYVASGT